MLQIDTKKLLALIILVGFFIIIVGLFFAQIPTGNLDLLKTIVVALIAIATTVAGYYFGSSEGSARKTELLVPESPASPSTIKPKKETTDESNSATPDPAAGT